MNDYFNMWMKQYFDALDFMNFKMENSVISKTLQTNDYVPFVENGLTDVINSWVKTK